MYTKINDNKTLQLQKLYNVRQLTTVYMVSRGVSQLFDPLLIDVIGVSSHPIEDNNGISYSHFGLGKGPSTIGAVFTLTTCISKVFE